LFMCQGPCPICLAIGAGGADGGGASCAIAADAHSASEAIKGTMILHFMGCLMGLT